MAGFLLSVHLRFDTVVRSRATLLLQRSTNISSIRMETPKRQEEGDTLVWYASIGSMMNRVGLAVRGIYPLESCPCIIRGRRRIFSEPGGMATLTEPEEGAECHCIAHLMQLKQLRLLEAREPKSVHMTAIIFRSGHDDSGRRLAEEKTAAVSLMQIYKETLPQERYIDIMVRGALQV